MCTCVIVAVRFFFCRVALLSVLKVLKLLLIASGFAVVCKMLMDKKQDAGKPYEDKRVAAKVLQSALEQVIPLAESKLKNVAINMAKLYVEKVGMYVCFFVCLLKLSVVNTFIVLIQYHLL